MANFERVFVVDARYCDNAAEARAPHRDAHVTRAVELRGEGVLVMAGAFEDLSGSQMVYRLPDEDAVTQLVESDVYWREDVWVDYTVRPYLKLAD